MIGAVMKDLRSQSMRIVNRVNLEVSVFLVSRGLWEMIAVDARDITDDDMKWFPECDHDEILKQRGLFS